MSEVTQNPDAEASQVMFLNFENPSNNANLCSIRQYAIDSLLGMLGLTPGFILSLSLAQKKAIVFLASYAVDWRSCVQEYKNITLCFGRLPRVQKAMISGLEQMEHEPLDHAQRILLDRIKPNIVHLHQRSYDLNRGISMVAPPDAVVPEAGVPTPDTVAVPVRNQPPQPSGKAASAPPTMANGPNPMPAATTTAEPTAVSNSLPLSVQTSAVPVSTSDAIMNNDSSSGIAVNITIMNAPIVDSTNNTQTTKSRLRRINEADAEDFSDDVDMANSDITNAADDRSEVTSISAVSPSAEDMDGSEGIEDDVQNDDSMQADTDETGPGAGPNKTKVRRSAPASVAGDDNEGPPAKRRRLDA